MKRIKKKIADSDEFDDMDRKQLKHYIKENDLEITVKKSMSDDDIRDLIREAVADSDDEDSEEEEIAEDEEVRHLAAKLIDERKIKKIPLQKLQNYGSYMMGMRMAYLKLFPKIINLTKKKDKPYVIAEFKLLISQTDATYDYQQGIYEIHYRNHKRNKKGELFYVEAYFVNSKGDEVLYQKVNKG